jgi:hypothetical protein
MEQVIRKELIEKFIKRFNENPNEVAEVVLRERFEYKNLKNNYEWLESENEFHQNFISTEEYQKSEDEYYESLKYLKQIYFENNN